MDTLIDTIVAYRFHIAGVLALAAIGAYLTGLNNRRNRLALAATKFRDIFHTELKGLYPIPSDWPKDFTFLDKRLRKSFVTLQAAVTEFRHFVPWYRKWFFDRAWHKYHLGKYGRDIDQQYYEQYHSGHTTTAHKGREKTTVTDGRKNLKHNVDNLLKYAKAT
jgi:hypothetical protein